MEARIIIITQASVEEVTQVLEKLFPEVEMHPLAQRAARIAQRVTQEAAQLADLAAETSQAQS